MKIPAHVLSAISNAANKYEKVKNQEFMFISENPKSKYPISSQKVHFGIKNFPHLIAMYPQRCSFEEFFEKCKNRTLTYDDFTFSSTHTIKDVFEKATNLGDFLDFKHIKMFKYGSDKNENNQKVQTATNKYNFGIGTHKGIIGYIKEGNTHKPKTTLTGDLNRFLPVNEPVIAVLTKKYNFEKYDEIFSELYQGKYAEVSHNMNPNALNFISIPHMEEQYKANVIKLIDTSLNNIFDASVCEESIRDKSQTIQSMLKDVILKNVDEIAKWLNDEISTHQGNTLSISTKLEDVLCLKTFSNVVNEGTRTINLELIKDTNKIGFTVKKVAPSLEKKDLLHYLAEGCMVIDAKFLNTQTNITEKDYEKYFADNCLYINYVDRPFLIVREADYIKIPIHIQSLDEIIAEKSVDSHDLDETIPAKNIRNLNPDGHDDL